MNLEVYVSEISRTYRNLSGKGGGEGRVKGRRKWSVARSSTDNIRTECQEPGFELRLENVFLKSQFEWKINRNGKNEEWN